MHQVWAVAWQVEQGWGVPNRAGACCKWLGCGMWPGHLEQGGELSEGPGHVGGHVGHIKWGRAHPGGGGGAGKAMGCCHGSSPSPPCTSEALPLPLMAQPISDAFGSTSDPTGLSVYFSFSLTDSHLFLLSFFT